MIQQPEDNLKRTMKHKVYEVVVESIKYYKDGSSRKTYSHTIKFPGWEKYFHED